MLYVDHDHAVNSNIIEQYDHNTTQVASRAPSTLITLLRTASKFRLTMNANLSPTPTSRTAGSSNSNATSGGRCGVLPQHRETPLATCEARARLAFKQGEIDEATYQILMGISAEALLTIHDEARGAAGPWTQPRKQITPCDTPPMIQREVIPVNGGKLSPYNPKLQLPGSDISVNEGGAALSALMALSPRTQAQEHSSPQEYAPEVKLSAASALSSISISISEGRESELDKISKQGFSLAERAQRNSEGTPGSAEEETERLLKFADACVKAYPPSPVSSKKPQEENDSSYDIIWQNRLGFEVPRDEGASSSPSNDKKNDAAQWEIRYEELLKFKTTHGHCKVSYRHQTESKCLSSWSHKQREQYKDGILLKTRYERLQQIDFPWEAKQAKLPKINDKNIRNYDDLWDHRFNQLKNYKDVTGHCNVPYRWTVDRQLGRWVQNQREFYKRKILSMDRYRRLAELGFCWCVRKAKADKSVKVATTVYTQCNTVTQNWALKKDQMNTMNKSVYSVK